MSNIYEITFKKMNYNLLYMSISSWCKMFIYFYFGYNCGSDEFIVMFITILFLNTCIHIEINFTKLSHE